MLFRSGFGVEVDCLMVNLNFVHSAITSCAAGARSWSLLEANATITTTARPRIMGCLSIKLTKVIVS